MSRLSAIFMKPLLKGDGFLSGAIGLHSQIFTHICGIDVLFSILSCKEVYFFS